MNDWTLYAHAFELAEANAPIVDYVSTLANDASYHGLDDREMQQARANGQGHGGDREDIEFALQWQRWRVAGRPTFLIGPETTARIMERVKAGDVPTEPVPPAYFEFAEPPMNYAASRPLRAAMISRGVVGRITMLTDAEKMRPGVGTEAIALTVYLPSVFGDRDLDNLKRGLQAARKPKKIDAGAMALARNMAAQGGGELDDAELENVARHIQATSSRGLDGRQDVQMDISAHLYDQVYGRISHRPNPLLPRAARVVLVAADEARKVDAEYARPQYLNDSAVSRNWMEERSQPVTLRDEVVHLP